MTVEPIIIERVYQARVEKVWKALTDKDQMKQWYFDMDQFEPRVGFEFSFEGKGEDGTVYAHLCTITEVIPNKKLAYTWRYAGREGNSLVTFELFDEEGATRLLLTHTGLESFPQDPAFARKNFVMGWTEITGRSLKYFVEKPAAR